MKYFVSTLAIGAITGTAAFAQKAQQQAPQSNNAAARETALPQTTWFSAESSHYFITTGCAPASTIAWYSHRWGGRLLKTATANAAGELRLKTDTGFRPAFALDNGTGRVGYLGAAEFTLGSVSADRVGGVAAISWKASAAAGVPIVFEVLRAVPGAAFSVAATYRAMAAGGMEPFSFTDPASAAGVQYRIRVRNEAAGERYLTRSLMQGAGTTFSVAIYPTIVKDALTINMQGGAAARYTIAAADGRIAGQGMLQEGLQVISLNAFAGGAYLVSVSSESGVATAKIVKE